MSELMDVKILSQAVPIVHSRCEHGRDVYYNMSVWSCMWHTDDRSECWGALEALQ
jgi:hypothetical protein